MKFPTSRRRFLELTTAVTGALAGCKRTGAQEDEGPRIIGQPLSKYGERSVFEKSARSLPTTKILENGSSLTPLQDSCGIITPSALHYERHHAGIPNLDPARHRLVIHGLVDRPIKYSVADLKRFPTTSRTYFMECSGTTGTVIRKRSSRRSRNGYRTSSAAFVYSQSSESNTASQSGK